MEIKDIKIGRRCRIKLNNGGGYHYAKVDSIQQGLLDEEPVILVTVLGELKVVSPDCLEKIKRPKKKA